MCAYRIPTSITSGSSGRSRRLETPDPDLVLVDEPAPGIRRFTLNRPDKRNALNHPLRAALMDGLIEADEDDDVRVMIIRGAGSCFSAGYDLGSGNKGQLLPHHTAGGLGHWPRHVTDTWMSIWDLAKPVIAQVHGYCLAGGSELATGCDLIYVAEDAQIGYPAVRMATADMHFHVWTLGMRRAMQMMLTGDSITGREAADEGWANSAHPVDELDDAVLDVATRIARIDPVLVQVNKRTVHRQMEVMGVRTGIRVGTELCTIGMFTPALDAFTTTAAESGLTTALDQRDAQFGDYRTSEAAGSDRGPADLHE
jgi:enoyl-CoA hydratase